MLRGEKIVFTGRLDTLSRKQAQALVTALGGKPQAAVTKDTTILVVGKANTNLFQEDPRSLKMQKVEALQQEGLLISVLSEKSFLEQVSAHLNQVVGMMNVTGK
jgi:DNA polymerase-3 subunit epsilon